ncbi:hypothetical protein NQ318_004743 [Aromia moschata]|uniref:Uncharacterized protein n=1 Tax=Aromia moschata TaxID=1265417 RepID=A0AAV8XX83_9CUCU|nr:hypothetical protein NQ318_004743 [Aromia moschata]
MKLGSTLYIDISMVLGFTMFKGSCRLMRLTHNRFNSVLVLFDLHEARDRQEDRGALATLVFGSVWIRVLRGYAVVVGVLETALHETAVASYGSVAGRAVDQLLLAELHQLAVLHVKCFVLTAAKAQQLPQSPWSLTVATAPWALQSRESATVALIIAAVIVFPVLGLGLRLSNFLISSLVMSVNLLTPLAKLVSPLSNKISFAFNQTTDYRFDLRELISMKPNSRKIKTEMKTVKMKTLLTLQ